MFVVEGSYQPSSGYVFMAVTFGNNCRVDMHFPTPGDFRSLMETLVEFSRMVDKVEYQWKNTIPELEDADRIIEEVFSKGGT